MGSRGGNASLRLVSACLALCLFLSRFSPCEGRKLLVAEEEGGKAMHFEGDPVLRVAPSPRIGYGPDAVLGGRPGAHRSTWCPECPPGPRD
ncbi:hypothetical protein GQ55_3G194300 [Panicum hallii var. hallii]|uniref:Uncharacterized protein n=1 Tax=Panicum hallii var. hallii TaxID=1504633 RepID=A0A2T7EB93_9POAL|nr:hypothetical protein GQ55_3G194300 [Panicum hallii var. hallii]